MTTIESLVGRKVKVNSFTMQNYDKWWVDKTYIVENVMFKVTTDGKCHTIVKLEGVDRTFSLKNLTVL